MGLELEAVQRRLAVVGQEVCCSGAEKAERTENGHEPVLEIRPPRMGHWGSRNAFPSQLGRKPQVPF